MESNNAWVLQSLEDRDLSLCCLPLHWISKLILLVYFHGVFTLIPLVKAKSYLGVSSLTDHTSNMVAL